MLLVSDQFAANSPDHVDNNYTYPQFVIDEKTGRVEVNFIDWASGRVIRHIPATELSEIVRGHGLIAGAASIY
jgi:hypothetical protein